MSAARPEPSPPVALRSARPDDEDAVLALVGADPLTRSRVAGDWPTPRQRAGLRRILEHPDHELLVAARGDAIVGVLQLSVLPEFAREGDRAQLETIHVADDERGRGVGSALVRHAIDRARDRGCGLVQLTSSKSRAVDGAHRFYVALGFEATHEGFKLTL